MRRTISETWLKIALLVVLVAFVPQPATGGFIADHNCVDLSVIPDRYLPPGKYDRDIWVLEARMGNWRDKTDDLVAQAASRSGDFDVFMSKLCYIDALGDEIISQNHTHATIGHCVLENVTTGCGGLIANCTFVDVHDGIDVLPGGTCTIVNSIFYHSAPIRVAAGATLHISYCDIVADGPDAVFGDGAVDWGPGNMQVEPCFAQVGDETTAGDYHLRSQAGRWDPVEDKWVQDKTTSRCIDAGDPDASWAAVPDMSTDAYFTFGVVGDEVRVTFLPKAIDLLNAPCRISWIDWYR